MLDLLDPQDPTLATRLRAKTVNNRYVIGETDLILAIRAYAAQGNHVAARELCVFLLERCGGHFQKYSTGLNHRPDLREDAIANMSEKLVREALDPREEFMLKNFAHYIKCLCVDEFNRILRQEGLKFTRNADGHPSGRGAHVPRSLISTFQASSLDDDAPPPSDVADTHDQYEHFHASEQCQYILKFLPKPLDRKIMVLRAIEGMKWDDIAAVCGLTERSIRMHYEKAVKILSDCLLRESSLLGQSTQIQL